MPVNHSYHLAFIYFFNPFLRSASVNDFDDLLQLLCRNAGKNLNVTCFCYVCIIDGISSWLLSLSCTIVH